MTDEQTAALDAAFRAPLDGRGGPWLGQALALPGLQLGCRAIRTGDEMHLLPGELERGGAGPVFPAPSPVAPHRLAALRASGAARAVARDLMARAGHAPAPIPRAAFGMPLFPFGLIGSLAHDEAVAVAALASASPGLSLGIDVEPLEALPEEIAGLVHMPGDVLPAGLDPALAARLLFSAKEAVYKAAFPLSGVVLGYEHIVCDLESGTAQTRTGQSLRLAFCLRPRIVVLAVAGAADRPMKRGWRQLFRG